MTAIYSIYNHRKLFEKMVFTVSYTLSFTAFLNDSALMEDYVSRVLIAVISKVVMTLMTIQLSYFHIYSAANAKISNTRKSPSPGIV